MSGYQGALDFEPALPFGEDDAIPCESVTQRHTAPAATMGEWIDRAHRDAQRKRETAAACPTCGHPPAGDIVCGHSCHDDDQYGRIFAGFVHP